MSFVCGFEVDFMLTDISKVNIQGVSFGSQIRESPQKTQGVWVVLRTIADKWW